MNGYQRRTQAKKEAIIQAASFLFSKRGVTDVSIKEIATKAGVSPVSIYNYFQDKHNLAKQVLITYLDESIQGYEELLGRRIPFSDKLQIIIERKFMTISQVSSSKFSEFAWEDEALQQIYREAATTKAEAIYSKFIELGKEEGMIDSTIPNEAILTYLIQAANTMLQPDYLEASPEYQRGLLKLFFYGILGKKQ